ncbi:unnamed protein product [Cuscuta campestris]|uniref:Uncharacterized protein n=1 Tax=Cuscuta campestris TaxID=132261 RepID=A0A484N1L1_9ASTE|nr:unnamed protein product [Cuscuta campestris]
MYTWISTKFVVLFLTFVLSVLFLVAIPDGVMAQRDDGCKTISQFCGGIVGFPCCKGLNCKLEGNFPDAGGVCVRQRF